MSKVGLLTFHHVHNYGAVLQCWSSVQVLRTLGHTVTVLDYRPHDPRLARRGLRRFVPSLGHWKMRWFVTRNLPMSEGPLRTVEELDAFVRRSSFDALVCGSDQVWMTYGSDPLDKAYFLGVGPTTGMRRISYAPSSGPLNSFGPHKSEAHALLANFQALSARDPNTQAAVVDAGLPEPQRVVDPTLLANFEPLVQGGSPTVTVLGPVDDATSELALRAARRLGVPLVAVGTRCRLADAQKPFASPSEWVTHIARARLVITSLFHGAAVSLSCRSPFLAVGAGGRAFKLEQLCAQFDIAERLLQKKDDRYELEDWMLDLDYSVLGPKVDQAIASSTDYLRGAV